MSIQEIKSEMEILPAQERRRLAAFLVSLRHRDLAEYQASLTKKIEDTKAENWLTLEEFDRRLAL